MKTHNEVLNGIKRAIYDAENKELLPGKLVKVESNPALDDPAVEALYENIKYFYDFFKLNFGRDSIDGKGMDLIGTVHYRQRYNNIFWNGNQIVCGDGDGGIFNLRNISGLNSASVFMTKFLSTV